MSETNEPPVQTRSAGGSNRRKRIEVVVWIGIALVCLALVVAGIGRARESAQRMECANNLKQLGLALHSYADFRGNFPAATMRNSELPPERRLSWQFALDPYIHARMDPDWIGHQHRAWDSEVMLPLGQQPMRVVACPRAPATTDARGLALTTYVGLLGIGPEAGFLSDGDPRTGVFHLERETPLGWVGLIETFMATETAVRNGPWIAGGDPTARSFELDGTAPLGRSGPFGNLHRGGANVLGADAHVEFVAATVTAEWWVIQTTRRRGIGLVFPSK